MRNRLPTLFLSEVPRPAHYATLGRPGYSCAHAERSDFEVTSTGRGNRNMKSWIFRMGIRVVEQETNFFARVRLAVRLLRAWGAYGKSH